MDPNNIVPAYPFVSNYNFHLVPQEMVQEKVDAEILVEPSESYTVRELVYRLAMGMPVASSNRNGDYPTTDQDFDDYLATEDPDFDLADYARLLDEQSSKRDAIRLEKDRLYREKQLGKKPIAVDIETPAPLEDVSTLIKTSEK